MKHDMMYQYLHCETFATYKYILVQLRGIFYTFIFIYHYFFKLLNTLQIIYKSVWEKGQTATSKYLCMTNIMVECFVICCIPFPYIFKKKH
jgi:hypothetical protein